MDRLTSMAVFKRAVDHGSFAAAARLKDHLSIFWDPDSLRSV
jgi:hypothetical protein